MCSRFWIDPTTRTPFHRRDQSVASRARQGRRTTTSDRPPSGLRHPNEIGAPRRLWITPQFLDPLVIGSLAWLRPKSTRPARKSHAPVSDVRSALSSGVPRSAVQAWVRPETPGQYGCPTWPQTSGWRTKVSLASRPCVT